MNVEDIWPEWKTVRTIGKGSFGRVYECTRNEMGLDYRCAVKLIDVPQSEADLRALRAQGLTGPALDAYVENCARAVASEFGVMLDLKGAPNVVAVEDCRCVKRPDGAGWTVAIRMELLDDVNERFLRMGQPSEAEVLRMGSDVCRALTFCAKQGIIHRDIKPGNIFVDRFGQYKLGDFGVARSLESGTSAAYSRKGTPNYMAPEVIKGKSYGHKADVYSVGIMMYRLLNGGRMPFCPQSPSPLAPMTRTQLTCGCCPERCRPHRQTPVPRWQR